MDLNPSGLDHPVYVCLKHVEAWARVFARRSNQPVSIYANFLETFNWLLSSAPTGTNHTLRIHISPVLDELFKLERFFIFVSLNNAVGLSFEVIFYWMDYVGGVFSAITHLD